MKAKVSPTLMAPTWRLTSLATSNASFFFVMGSRALLLFVAKIWQSQLLSHPRVNGPSGIPSISQYLSEKTGELM